MKPLASCALALLAATGIASAGVWPDGAPADCPFPKSPLLTGVEFTGRHVEYTKADTWYPSWASDGNLYSPFTDGTVDAVKSFSGPPTWVTGNARIEGDDPLQLKVVPLGVTKGLAAPYGGRYPCGTLVHDGVWYYGTYALDWHRDPWDVMGPFIGFRLSRDFGQTWEDSPRTPAAPLFGEVLKPADTPATDRAAPNVSAAQFRTRARVKMGSPHFVDFGRNMVHSPDGRAYLLENGAARADATCSWISGDQVYLARVKPSPETINDPGAYEFFAGRDAQGQPAWTKEFAQIQPLLEWNDRLGCATATWNPVLRRFLLCTTDGGASGSGAYDTLLLEAEQITGPWRRIALLEKLGQQAYFVNIPSKFIQADGRTMWLCYAANWSNQGIRSDPPGSRYGLCLQEIRLLDSAPAAAEKVATKP